MPWWDGTGARPILPCPGPCLWAGYTAGPAAVERDWAGHPLPVPGHLRPYRDRPGSDRPDLPAGPGTASSEASGRNGSGPALLSTPQTRTPQAQPDPDLGRSPLPGPDPPAPRPAQPRLPVPGRPRPGPRSPRLRAPPPRPVPCPRAPDTDWPTGPYHPYRQLGGGRRGQTASRLPTRRRQGAVRRRSRKRERGRRRRPFVPPYRASPSRRCPEEPAPPHPPPRVRQWLGPRPPCPQWLGRAITSRREGGAEKIRETPPSFPRYPRPHRRDRTTASQPREPRGDEPPPTNPRAPHRERAPLHTPTPPPLPPPSSAGRMAGHVTGGFREGTRGGPCAGAVRGRGLAEVKRPPAPGLGRRVPGGGRGLVIGSRRAPFPLPSAPTAGWAPVLR